MTELKELVVATGNIGKLAEMQAYLAEAGWHLILKPAELEVPETGSTFMENACLKASQTALFTKKWAIADDSGLTVDALNGAPGIYSARYSDTDAGRIKRLLTELAGESNRQAQFVCAIAIAQPDGAIVVQATGICPGEILPAPSGDGGFGYDPIFYVPAEGLSFAQMPPTLKKQISHRGQAMADAQKKLAALNQ
jgi:XTP/dITP diphosphohydrolase